MKKKRSVDPKTRREFISGTTKASAGGLLLSAPFRESSFKTKRLTVGEIIVLGHMKSEDPGSIYKNYWLLKNVPGVDVKHTHSGNPFKFK